jgi:uncharacterized protein YggE
MRAALLLPLLAVGLLYLGPSPALADDDNDEAPRTLTVTGSGEVSAAPDRAFISAGVVTTGSTAREALDRNNEAAQRVHELLAAEGLAAADIQTTTFTIYPRYADNTNPPLIIGFEVNNMLTITVRDLDKLGSLLDKLVSEGANQLYGIQFVVSDSSPRLDEARRAAVADARRKAELLAGEAGASLGRVLALDESGGIVPMPLYSMRAEAAMAEVPIAQGEQVLSTSVRVVFELR